MITSKDQIPSAGIFGWLFTIIGGEVIGVLTLFKETHEQDELRSRSYKFESYHPA
jgi:hypothetical protein